MLCTLSLVLELDKPSYQVQSLAFVINYLRETVRFQTCAANQCAVDVSLRHQSGYVLWFDGAAV
jgi:hypothetical protein